METLVHDMLGFGSPAARHGRKTSPSARTEMLAEFNIVIRGFPPAARPSSSSQDPEGSGEGCSESIWPVADTVGQSGQNKSK